MKYLLLALLLPVVAKAQSIPKNANTITVAGVSFQEVCSALLDRGYMIDKKDVELQTVRTEARTYPRYWNAEYTFNIRIKDSVAYLSGVFTSPPQVRNPLFKNEPIYFRTSKRGEVQAKSINGYPFLLLVDFAKSLGKHVEYAKN